MLPVFHLRFVFVLFETFRFCKAVRVVFPDLHNSRLKDASSFFDYDTNLY